MKLRNGFVSNSSSSSFIIQNNKLSEIQRELIIHHIEVSNMLHKNFPEKVYPSDNSDKWTISETSNYISGFTSLDNFDMQWYLEEFLSIAEEIIEWGE